MLLQQIEQSACEDSSHGNTEQLARFVRAYYQVEPIDSLRTRGVDELAAVARAQFQFIRQRLPGQALIRVRPPSWRSAAGLAVLESCIENKPYLVDSVLMRLRDAGAAIDWAAHPVIALSRTATGELTGIGSGVSESVIHIEFEPLRTAREYAELEQALRATLQELTDIVDDYPAMRKQLRVELKALETVPSQGDPEEWAEAREFLAWLDRNHFSFFGAVRDRPKAGSDPRTALGLLRAEHRYDSEMLFAPQQELDKYEDSKRVIVITKATQRSPVHLPDYMDVISVKHFNAQGRRTYLVRFIGLFSTDVYIERPRNIPLIRRKAQYVMEHARLPEDSHYGKHLRDILHQLPRDELFQSSEAELFSTAMGILALHDRQPLKLFMRRDRYGRFYSCMVYLPREHYSWQLRDRVEQELLAVCQGLGVDRRTDWLRDGMILLHFIVRTPPGTQISESVESIEQRLIDATRSWRDQLKYLLRQKFDAAVAARFADAFAPSYAEMASPAEAVEDVGNLLQLSDDQPLLARLHMRRGEGADDTTAIKLYAPTRPAGLSEALPKLTHFGVRVTRQEATEVHPAGGRPVWIQRFETIIRHRHNVSSPLQRLNFELAFMAAWNGQIEDDGLNQLVISAGLTARRVNLLRAVCKYLLQTGLPFGQNYLEQMLSDHAAIARLLVELFEARFLPGSDEAQRGRHCDALSQAIEQALDGVTSLDADRVLRAMFGVIRATLRTNYFQHDAQGGDKPWLSFKFDSSRVPELPLPRPMFEVWVYAPWMEGIHLRGGRVARGGLRWSDRMQDFRTEVLGLMKAQMVKNAIIVPVGAKGGFVVKQAVDATDRDAWLAAGIECYQTFLRGLLDVTDNRVGTEVVAPREVIRYDDDDPYLAVAADKGTATFSDLANQVAAEYDFWLGDAFASGGKAGYDHKKMGITARGAWESVKRHFLELGLDIQNQPFTCVGIGDMSGDVFGNGMLLSRQTRLVAAFDHRHIFIDPDPNPEASWAERQRLFALARSSWADYDTALISAGGGVWPRTAKTITLSARTRALLQVDTQRMTPPELIRAVLMAPVDLLWNGGIGTYVKAHTENNQDIGDRSNDAVRVNADQLGCRVVGEGGNLGFTQLARVEYALAGGRINTDAIDNAAGVHTSDREVNIKIPLNQLMREQRITREARDRLLATLTDDIAHAVLYDNYVQSEAISLLESNAARRLDNHIELIRLLEREHLLDRAVEFLPDDEALAERRTRDLGLTRPELAVLMAYAKISLYQAALHSEIVDDPFFRRDLLAYFPPELVARMPEELARHQLRREIVATLVSNSVVNRMGPAFAHLQADDHGLRYVDMLKAYATAHQIFNGDDYWQRIESMDSRLACTLQYRLMNYPIGLLKHATAWFANSHWATQPIGEAVERFARPVAQLAESLPDILPPVYLADWEKVADQLQQDGVPAELARNLANTRALGGAMDIAELAERHATALIHTAQVYYLCGARFGMLWVYGAINELTTRGKWQELARVNLRDDAYPIHRQIAGQVLAQAQSQPQEQLDAWIERNRERVALSERRLVDVQATGKYDFSTLAVAVRELRKLRRLS
ncbi:NAD-glutamate dehydrogenase [Acidihalobacter ferrooxydans]|nr:NAD-glutamate dehydrogenase [Acidihalobacter ferrooxydans]